MKNLNATFKMANGFTGYDIDVARIKLNYNYFGKYIFMGYLRELNIIDKYNYPIGIYRTNYYLEKITLKNGCQKLIISDAGLEYFLTNHIYDKIIELDEKYCELKGIR